MMQIIQLPRQMGKSERLLQWLVQAPEGEHRIFVSHTLVESHRMQRLAYERGLIPKFLETWQFGSHEEVVNNSFSTVLHFRSGRIVLGVDNLDLLLTRIMGHPVGAVTVTREV